MVAAKVDLNVDCRQVIGGKPLVTAITIFLNAERFIEEAIESVFAQSYKEWELVLVDDGSTDGSTETARRYANLYPQKVRYVEHPGHENRGMSASRNLGLSEAQGDYIAFLDSDDVWLPEKLEEQVAILNAHPEAAMVLGATQYWYSWTGNSDDATRDFVPEIGVRPDTLVKPPTLASVLLRNQIATSTACLARREIVQQLGGYEESFRGLFEDQVFYSKVSLSAPVFVSSKCWYKYRKHSDSCCSVVERAGEHHAERLTFLNWLEAYSLEHGIDDADLRSAINKERWKSSHPRLSRASQNARYRIRTIKEGLKAVARHSLPGSVHRWLRSRRRTADGRIPFGFVRFGDLRRLTPISRVFGFDRGTPIDRYYIENFLARNANDIRGRVLEVGDDTYNRKFGGDRVTKKDVLHVSAQNPRATIVADLATGDHIPSDSFDCIVLTQTLHLIYDVRGALSTLHRILKPGGILLVTVPGISQIDHYDWGETWYWSFTTRSARRLFEEVFPADRLEVQTHGNVLAATAFLHGISVEELCHDELDYDDPDYQVTIAVRAMKEVCS
jgi:glycosyltransferase involved in cell wall biosynthesis